MTRGQPRLARQPVTVAVARRQRGAWDAILERAAAWVRSLSTGATLRQTYYFLVAAQLIANTRSEYNALSKCSTDAREQGRFPGLIDRTRTIHRVRTWARPEDALQWAARSYRRDRTEGQKYALYIGVEKNGFVEQLTSWFWELGLPVLALGGYASHTFKSDVVDDVRADGRPAILIYAGDLDSSGEDLERDFVAKTDCWKYTIRVALTREQVDEYDLPPAMGKDTDKRAQRFIDKYGENIQVELDALPPDVLRALYQAQIDRFFDTSIYEESLAREAADDRYLAQLVRKSRRRR